MTQGAIFPGLVGMRIQPPGQRTPLTPRTLSWPRYPVTWAGRSSSPTSGAALSSLLIFGTDDIIADESLPSGDWHLEQDGRGIQSGHLDTASLDSAAP